MTAPQNFMVRKWRVDYDTARMFLKFEKKQAKGVKATNRRASARIVNDYAFDMLGGDWGFCHQGFACTGRLDDGTAELKDGGQRCRALIQACTVGATKGGVTYPPNPDLSFEVMVTEGLDEDSWRVMDIGKRRTAGDLLGMEGEVNGHRLSSVITLCWLYDNEPAGVPFSRERWNTKISPLMRLKYLEDNPGIREALLAGGRLGDHMNVATASAAYYLALKAGVAQELIDEFMDSMASGVGRDWDEGNPILRLREMLGNARRSKRVLRREEQLALFVKALNAWLKGYKIGNLSFKTMPSTSTRQGKLTTQNAEAFPRFQP